MTTPAVPVTPALRRLERLFAKAGHELWLVGGCVRDTLMGVTPKDIDLATSATPVEQIELYQAKGIRFVPTGLQHGTVTVIMDDEIYEITTFRTDIETDGRHASVSYTRDLAVDLERRDLTVNAIAMGFNGTIVDPFGGHADIEAGRIRFVGDADRRIREDYLRILRWFRFLGRFAVARGLSPTACIADRGELEAIRRNASGLARISVERIWSEMSRILTGPNPVSVMRLINETGVDDAIGMGLGYEGRLQIAHIYGMDAATTLGGYLADFLDEDRVERTVIAWKLSNEEKYRARFVNRRILDGLYTVEAAKLDLVGGEDYRLVADTLRLARNPNGVAAIDGWDVPVFPIAGRDLIKAGMKPGPDVGVRMKELRERWIASDYSLTADDLLATMPA